MSAAFSLQFAMHKRVQWAAYFVTLAVCLLVWVRGAHALEVPALASRVNDLANVLEPQQEQALEERLASYEQQSGHQFAVLTLRSLEGEAIEPYALRVVEAWKLGQKQKDDGLLMLVAVDDRKMRIEVGYGLEGNIPDTLAGRIIRNVMAPEFRSGDYAAGINKAFDALMQAASGQAVQMPKEPPRAKEQAHGYWPLVWVVLFLIFGLAGGRRGGMFFLPLLLGGSHGHRSGGFRGGGGFGGGGGSFGGGGASGDW